jgi:hypothetical protein
VVLICVAWRSGGAAVPPAQDPRPSSGIESQNDPRPAAIATARTGQIVIDGRLGDAVWRDAPVIGDFRQQHPDEGRAPPQRTELRIVYDASGLFVAARMFDSDGPGAGRRLLVRRDQLLLDVGSDEIASCWVRIATARPVCSSSSTRSA